MLLTMLFDDEDEGYVSALFQVGDQVLQLKQKPHEGRVCDRDKEEQQEYVMTHPEAAAQQPSSAADGEYDSAFPNVGLVVWQAGFVLGEYLLRTQPLGPWSSGLKVLELGCGTGQLGIVLALAGAAVTLTDLEHIVPLTQANVDLNVSRCSITPCCAAYMWGTPVDSIPQAGEKQQQQQQPSQQQGVQQDLQEQQQGKDAQPPAAETTAEQAAPCLQQQQGRPHWDVIVAADVLYEPHHYDELLQSLTQLCPPPTQPQHTNTLQTAGPQQQPEQQQQQPEQEQQQHGDGQVRSPPVYICYRVRRYAEHGFESKAAACGFKVSAVPVEELHKDYQCGGYRLICLQRE